MKTYEIKEAGYVFATRKGRSAESAVRAQLRETKIYATDYNCNRGDMVEIEWWCHQVDGDDYAVLRTKVKAK